MISDTSRYRNCERAELAAPDGRRLGYLRRRLLPPSAATTTLAMHQVAQSDRLDNIAAQYLGDPELFWRICDANDAMHPRELTATIGRRLRIPLNEGG